MWRIEMLVSLLFVFLILNLLFNCCLSDVPARVATRRRPCWKTVCVTAGFLGNDALDQWGSSIVCQRSAEGQPSLKATVSCTVLMSSDGQRRSNKPRMENDKHEQKVCKYFVNPYR